jgi:hypothetical protein
MDVYKYLTLLLIMAISPFVYIWGRDVGKEKGVRWPGLYGLYYGAVYCAIGQIVLIILRKLGIYPD